MAEPVPTLLSALTTLQVGGPARQLIEVDDTGGLVETVTGLDRAGEQLLVLGGGSNLLVADVGFPGTVVRVGTRGVRLTAQDGTVDVEVAAGEPWDPLVARCVDEGLAGLEALSGIPGLAGATPLQNVGAYGQEVAQTISEVRVLDRADGRVRTLPAAECAFGYRTSVLKRTQRFVVLQVRFRLVRASLSRPVTYAELARALGVRIGAQVPSAHVRAAVIDLRRAKGMVLDPADPDTTSAGSFFTNPVLDRTEADRLPLDAPRWPVADGRVKTSAAWLIERAGFAKGYGAGPARLSTKHPLAVTNRGGATAADLLALAKEVRDAVQDRFGVELLPEPVLVGCSL